MYTAQEIRNAQESCNRCMGYDENCLYHVYKAILGCNFSTKEVQVVNGLMTPGVIKVLIDKGFHIKVWENNCEYYVISWKE